MPYWSIAEWRARIGSSWCALGQPVKSKSSYRRGSGWVQRVLTLNQVVTIVIMMIMLIGVNHTLYATISGGYCLPLTNLLPGGAVFPILYLFQLGNLLFLAFRNCAPLLYQLFPIILMQSLQQFCYDLMKSLYFSVHVFHRLLFLISLLVYTILWAILYVTLKLDWLRAVTIQKEVLTNGETKTTTVIELELGSRSEILRWLARAKSLLDTVLSAAASVIDFLLLLSGDVEENPGPGDLDYNNVDSSQILEPGNLIDVMEEVESIQSLYFPLGQALRLKKEDLKKIRDKYPDAREALEEVLLLWLQKQYNIESFGSPTWKMIVEAVDRKGGGNNHELAKEIASKHPAECTQWNDTLVSKEKSTDSDDGAGKTSKPVANIEANKEEELLGIGDMREVQDFFWDVRAKWKNIGLGLGIDVGTLDSIEKTNRMVVEDCLHALLKRWLQHNSPKPTRSAMNKVLHSKPLASASSSGEACDVKLDYAQYLKSLYKVKTLASCSDDDQWPPPVTDKVFRLAIIKTEEQVRRRYSEEDLVREKTIAGKVDNILECKISIELEDIFKETKHQRELVLMEGAPGSGKSTLSIHICHQWMEGNLFQEYELVILVKLRELPIQNAKSIAELLPRRNEIMGQNIEKIITDIDGRNVLFVLDGWDEISQDASAYSIILNLIKGTQLHESSIIITSRPTSSAILHTFISLRTEILGFTKKELHQFFMKCLENSHQAVETLLQRIRQDPILEGNCYLPLNASILVHLFKCGGNVLPTTQYGIFTELVRSCIYRHLNKTQQQDISELESWDHLPFQKLCKLAYDGIMKDRVVFDLSSDFNTLGLLQGVESFAKLGKSYSFNFLHLSIQELLAAIYMATRLEESKQTEQFNKLFGKSRFAAVFQFFAAKTKLRTSKISDVVKKVAKKCAVGDPRSGDKALLVSLIHCLFEAQDSSLCQLVAGELKQKLDLTSTSLTPADCYCLGYFLTYCKDFEVELAQCTIDKEHVKSLFRKGEVYNLRLLK